MDAEKVEAALAKVSAATATTEGATATTTDGDGSTPSPEKEETLSSPPASSADAGEKVDFKVIYNKKKYDITFPLDGDVGALKAHLQVINH